MYAVLQTDALLLRGCYPDPLLDFDFVNNVYRQDGVGSNSQATNFITTTRASTGYADNTGGVWSLFNNNVPRITDKGLLVEEARTNSIRNNSMQGAVAGSPGTLPTNWATNESGFTALTRTLSLGTQNGIDYIELNYTGTPSSTGTLQIRSEAIAGTIIPASSGQTWTYAAFVSNSSSTGVTALRPAFLGVNNAGVQQEAVTGTVFTGDTAFSRRPLSITLAQAGTVSVSGDVRVSVTSGTPINYTVRIGWPQIELGAFATSPIRTTNAVATRAADVVKATVSPTLTDNVTLFGKATPVGTTGHVLAVSDGTLNNRNGIARSSGSAFAANTVAGGTVAWNVATGAWPSGVSAQIAGGFAVSNRVAYGNGTQFSTNASALFPTGINSVDIGNVAAAGQLNGYVERVALWPAMRLHDADLQYLTAAPPALGVSLNLPDLDLNFVLGTYYQTNNTANTAAGLLTTSRASIGYADDTSGNWTSFSNNVARITNKGLLVEESRTNSAPNNSISGAVAASPGTFPTLWSTVEPTGLTRTISLGTTNGIEWIEINYTGTTTSTAAFVIRQTTTSGSPAASSGQTWTQSAWVSNPSSVGLVSLNLTLSGLDSSNVQSEFLGISVLNQAWARSQVTKVLSAGTTTKVNHVFTTGNVTSGTVVNITLRIGWPQSEQGAFASSPIRTTAAAVTRAADIVTVTTPPVFSSGFTEFAKATPNAPITYTSNQGVLAISDGTATNRVTIARSSSTGNAGVIDSIGGANTSTVWAQGVSGKLIQAFASGDQATSFNGGLVATSAGVGIPAGLSVVQLGLTGSGAGAWNGYIEQVSLWPNQRLSNGHLQLLTGTPAPGWVLRSTTATADIDLDFVNDLYFQNTAPVNTLAALVTVTRASVGYAADATGVWSSFANNIARRTNLGLMVEEARTNSIRNNSMQGAVPGTPGTLPTNWGFSSLGTLTSSVIGVGTENGVDYIDLRINGTSSIQFLNLALELGNAITTALNGQTWANSCFLKLQGGSFTNVFSTVFLIQELDSGGVFILNDSSGPLAITSNLQRFTQIVTLNGGATVGRIRPFISFNFTGTVVAVDFTIRIGWPQTELGSFATSPIRTTAAAVTRAADVVTVTIPPTFGSAFTLFAAGTPIAPTTFSNNQMFMYASDGTLTNVGIISRGGGTGVGSPNAGGTIAFVAGATNGSAIGNAILLPAGVPGKIAAAFSNSGTISKINIGTRSNGSLPFDGFLRRVACFATVGLDSTTMQGLTTL